MVEIHIDTKKDSKDEIKKIIAYLKSIVNDESYSYGSSDSGENYNTEEGMFNIFGSSSDDDKDDKKEGFGFGEDEEDDEPIRITKY